ncbi:MAG: hypothetical protein AAGJ35_11200, partial [Myxococcota bacterium]
MKRTAKEWQREVLLFMEKRIQSSLESEAFCTQCSLDPISFARHLRRMWGQMDHVPRCLDRGVWNYQAVAHWMSMEQFCMEKGWDLASFALRIQRCSAQLGGERAWELFFQRMKYVEPQSWEEELEIFGTSLVEEWAVYLQRKVRWKVMQESSRHLRYRDPILFDFPYTTRSPQHAFLAQKLVTLRARLWCDLIKQDAGEPEQKANNAQDKWSSMQELRDLLLDLPTAEVESLLRGCLADRDPKHRARAMILLSWLQPLARSSAPALVSQLFDEHHQPLALQLSQELFSQLAELGEMMVYALEQCISASPKSLVRNSSVQAQIDVQPVLKEETPCLWNGRVWALLEWIFGAEGVPAILGDRQLRFR